MKCLLLLTGLFCAAFANTTIQVANITLPQCALNCMTTTSDTIKVSCTLPHYALEQPLGGCLFAICSIPESLATLNATAHACNWPPRNRSALLQGVTLSLLIVATLGFAARVTTKLPKCSGSWGPDDYVMTVSWIFLISWTMLCWLCCKYGYGKDIWTLSFVKLEALNLLLKLCFVNYSLVSWLIRMSVLLLYLRLFPDEVFRRVVKVLLLLFGMLGLTFTVFFLRQIWVSDGENQNQALVDMSWAQIYLVIVADLGVVVLPLPTIWKLRLAMEKKISIMSMFGIGLFVTVVSAYRAFVTHEVEHNFNYAWFWLDIHVWTAAEINLGLFCACMPGIRAFVRDTRRNCGRPNHTVSDPVRVIERGGREVGGICSKNNTEFSNTTTTTEPESIRRLHTGGV